MENQTETEEAIEAAEALNLPLQVDLFKDSDVEAVLPKVVELIEEPDPVKASIGVPFYWVAEKAAEATLKSCWLGRAQMNCLEATNAMLTNVCKEGSEKVRKTMFDDVVRIHESNLERDLKITGFLDVELRLPFASFDFAEFALGLPLEFKIESKADTLRKLVLRKVALNAGMPVSIADKPKKAVQYSTGINDAVKSIAKNQEKTVNEYIDEIFKQSKNNI